ncbi:MAG: hypothetical protein ACI8QT_001103, partial [Halioglobus sp.]
MTRSENSPRIPRLNKRVLTVGLALSAAVGFAAQAQLSVEEVLVTGSYIKSTARDGASPVEVIG